MNNLISTFFKCFLTTSVGTLPVALVAYSAYPSSLEVINFDGSSTAQPFIQYLFTASSDTNNAITPPSNININIQASGTSTGVMKLVGRKTDFALSSKDSHDWYTKPHISKEWTSRQFKTLTIAQDAIVLLYKGPKGCDVELTLNKDKFKTIYSVFTGHKFPAKTDLFSTLIDSNANTACNKPIVAHSRVGGANKSGTAYSFINSNPLFKKIESEITGGSDQSQKDWLQKVKSSNYGADFKTVDHPGIQFTAETSSLAFDSFIKGLNDKKHASMVYLSASFVLANWDRVQAQGFKVAQYKKDDSSTGTGINKDNLQTAVNDGTYGWVRNINIIYAIYKMTPNQKTIINHIVKHNSKLSSLYVVPISFLGGSSGSAGQTAKTYPKSQIFTYNKDCNFHGWTASTCPNATTEKSS